MNNEEAVEILQYILEMDLSKNNRFGTIIKRIAIRKAIDILSEKQLTK